MQDSVPAFRGLCKDVVSTPVMVQVGDLEVHANPPDWDGYGPPPDPLPEPTPPTEEEGGEKSEFLKRSPNGWVNVWYCEYELKCISEMKVKEWFFKWRWNWSFSTFWT